MILVTNDDGYDSDGLVCLQQALRQVDEVLVVAPSRNWTAAGHTKTMHRPLRATEITLADGTPAYSSDGTPSDCVALALLGFARERPRLIFSGINKGPNMGGDISYSGTVSAAMEGVVWGIPSVAVSLDAHEGWDFSYAADFSARLAARILEKGIGGDVLLNVNVPGVPRSQIQSVEITRLGKRLYRDQLITRKDPFGREYYWIGGDLPSGELEPGTDIAAVASNSVSVTPILMDLTNHRLIGRLKEWGLTA